MPVESCVVSVLIIKSFLVSLLVVLFYVLHHVTASPLNSAWSVVSYVKRCIVLLGRMDAEWE